MPAFGTEEQWRNSSVRNCFNEAGFSRTASRFSLSVGLGRLAAIADAGQGAVLFHCTVGKDRTGILAALLLAALGVGSDAIVDDYALTSGRIKPIQDRMMAEFIADGVDAEAVLPLFFSDPSTMSGMLGYIDREYGGIETYLDLLDPDRSIRGKLSARMLC